MDRPDLDEAYKQLLLFRELLADYVEAGARQPASVHEFLDPAFGHARGLQQVQLTMRATLSAVDRCLSTIEAINSAGGVGEYIRAHLPPSPPG